MDGYTKEVMSWDMGHLTQQQIDHLHALKTLAQHVVIRKFLANLKKSEGR